MKDTNDIYIERTVTEQAAKIPSFLSVSDGQPVFDTAGGRDDGHEDDGASDGMTGRTVDHEFEYTDYGSRDTASEDAGDKGDGEPASEAEEGAEVPAEDGEVGMPEEDGENASEPYRPRHTDSSMHVIVSTMAYLLGVPKRIFENEHEPPQIGIYNGLDGDKRARIVRNLCMLRTAIERNFKQISDRMQFSFTGLSYMPDIVPADCVASLLNDGITAIRSNGNKLNKYIIDINLLISDRINNCREFFPLWLNWAYIRELFIMPDGFSENGIKLAAGEYVANRSRYPYQVYMNWRAANDGNILHNDKKFVTLLYSRHGEKFTDFSKVADVGTETKNNIYDFLNASMRTVLVVDCENSDPYKLCATLKRLDNDSLEKIVKIILYDDVHASSAWGMVSSFTDIPVEHIMNERIKQNKSLVDINLTAGVCKEFYRFNVDSFVIFSSDSDYWGLISSIPEAKFLVMVEREKCGPDIKATLKERNIFYCYIDDFYSGDTHDIMILALMKEIRRYIDSRIRLNVADMMNDVFRTTRIRMTDMEKRQFYEKYIKSMSLHIDPEGNVNVVFNK